jgi:pimeloyl-ACP methyl ester carboxylesterase
VSITAALYTAVVILAAIGLLSVFMPLSLDIRYEPYRYAYQGQQIQAELGRFTVPERAGNPNGRKITLAFVRLKSTSPHPGALLVYLAGGPGGSAIHLAKGPRGAVFLAMREAGDVIAFDQRGVGLSEPNLDCPDSLGFPLHSPAGLSPLLSLLKEKSRSCASYWRTRGVDPAAYNVVESAHDLDSLRRALGVKKIRLWGSSYGTTLGLATIRYHGAGVERAVLAGIEGPDDALKLPSTAERQLRTVAKLVAADRSLSREIPDFRALLTRVVATATSRSITIPVADSKSKGTVPVTLGRFDLEQLVIGKLGDRAGLEELPRMLLDLDRGRLSSPLVQEAAQEIIEERTGTIGSAMSFATDCASGASPERLARIERETKAGMLAHLDFPIPDVCPAWRVPTLPAHDRTPVRSEVPVLFISGTLDGRTPPENADAVRNGFPNSHRVLIEGAGHGNDLFVSSPEIQRVMVEFMKTGKVVKNSIQLPPLQFR